MPRGRDSAYGRLPATDWPADQWLITKAGRGLVKPGLPQGNHMKLTKKTAKRIRKQKAERQARRSKLPPILPRASRPQCPPTEPNSTC